jgi:hypothetical protein
MSHSQGRQGREALAVVLILCILVVGGLASAQSIIHESHHAHHQKSTHSTVLCSWMCAAGQTHDASFIAFAHELHVLSYIGPSDFIFHINASPTLFATRAPPQPVA